MRGNRKQHQSVLEDIEDQARDDSPGDIAFSPLHARAAQNRRRDRIHLIALTRERLSGIESGCDDHAGDPGTQPADRKNDHFVFSDIDSRAVDCELIGAAEKAVVSEERSVQDQRSGCRNDQRQNYRDIQRADLSGAYESEQTRESVERL